MSSEVGRVERIGLGAILFGLLVFGVAFLSYVVLPSGRWMTIRHIAVHDSKVGEEIKMDLDQVVHREFEGTKRVAIWRFERSGWVPVCSTGWMPHPYQPDEVMPIPTTLRWHTREPVCFLLSPGFYRMESDWEVNTGTIFKRDITKPNVFFEVLQ